MANTFKLVTKAGVTSEDVIYTVAGSTTTVVLGIMLGNTTTSQVTVTLTLSSDTANRAGANNEANQDVELVTNAPIPAGSSLELLSGNKTLAQRGASRLASFSVLAGAGTVATENLSAKLVSI